MKRLYRHHPNQTESLSVLRSNTLELLTRPLLLLSITIIVITLAGCSSDGDDADAKQDSITQTSEQGSADTGTETTLATNTEDTSSGGGVLTTTLTTNENPLPALSVTDYVIVSSKRTGRTRSEYTLKIKVANSGSQQYENVLATLDSAPAHIEIIDGVVNIDRVPPNSVTISPDTFVVDVDLAVGTSFDELQWSFEGDATQPPPPPPPSGGPSTAGYFMSIDNNAIPGESTSVSHEDWIELTSFTEGLRRDSVVSGTSRRRTSFTLDGVTTSKLLDKSSPKLRQALAEGRFFGEIKIDIIAACSGNLYTAYAITLSTAKIASLSMTASNETPIEHVGLMYSRIETMYTPVESDCTLGSPVLTIQDGALMNL